MAEGVVKVEVLHKVGIGCLNEKGDPDHIGLTRRGVGDLAFAPRQDDNLKVLVGEHALVFMGPTATGECLVSWVGGVGCWVGCWVDRRGEEHVAISADGVLASCTNALPCPSPLTL